jgi:hypothetical protein
MPARTGFLSDKVRAAISNDAVNAPFWPKIALIATAGLRTTAK